MRPALTHPNRGRRRGWPLAWILALGLPGAAGAQEASQPDAADEPAAEAKREHVTLEPLWEIGVGGFAAYAPDYPAAEEGRIIGLAIPYAIYRGEMFRVGEDSVASIVPLDEPTYELDFSFDAAFQADSDGNEAREGMPDLDFLLEAGPQLTFRLREWDFGAMGWGELELPIQARAVFSTDFSGIRHEGFVFQPGITYSHDNVAGTRFNASASVQPLWATEGLQDFFYQVDPRFQRPDRPAFDAEGGYLGTEISLGGEYPISASFSLFMGMQLGVYAGAANESSPIHRRDYTLSGGFGFVWSFLQSERMVRR